MSDCESNYDLQMNPAYSDNYGQHLGLWTGFSQIFMQNLFIIGIHL